MSRFEPEELFAYDLSPRIIDSLELMYFDSSTVEEVTLAQQQQQQQQEQSTVQVIKPVQHKDREYYNSDIYKLNLKRQSRGLPPLTESEFEELASELFNESLSGSEEEDSEEDGDDNDERYKTDTLDTIFERSIAKLEQLKLEQEEEGVVSHLATRSPFILFKSSLLDSSHAFGVYKSLFSVKEINDPINALKSWQSQQGKKSAIFMIGGGHFAGAIVSHAVKSTKGQVSKTPSDLLLNSVDFIMQKSFHRYTTRRKQGGSQSAMDNAKGKANSAGSNLRRANEMALQNEVRELLQSWKKQLNECDSIFIRANGMQNRRILVGYEGSPFANDDDRIRSFPFTTKRATTSELKRAWLQLTSLTITAKPKVDDKVLKQKALQQQLKQSKSNKVKETDKVTPEETQTREIVGFLKKSRGPVLITYMKKNQLSPQFELQPESEYYHTPTVLHYASAHGLKNLIGPLLKNLKCDPTALNKSGKTAYDLSANISVKQAFRIARSELGESIYDWERAHVESPLKREDIEREDLERKAQEEQEKKKAQRELLEQKVEPATKNNKRLGGVSISQVNINSLTDDQRMRLMREQRARAAEARMKLQQK